MGIFVADTHALVWYLGGSPRLSRPAREVFDSLGNGLNEVVVPAIVIAEMVMLAERRPGALDVGEVVARLRLSLGYQLTSLDPRLCLAIRTLTQFSYMHDRLIVAEAQAIQETVITRDELVTASGLVPTVW